MPKAPKVRLNLSLRGFVIVHNALRHTGPWREASPGGGPKSYVRRKMLNSGRRGRVVFTRLVPSLSG